MDKRSKRIIGALIIAIVTLIVIEISSPKPINWKPNYTATDKIPLGSYVFFNELKNLYKVPVNQIDKDPYLFINDSTYKSNSLYFFVNDYLYFDKRQFQKLNKYVEEGNTVFLSARYFDKLFKDSLHIKTYLYNKPFETEITPLFFNPKLGKDTTAKFKKLVYQVTFTSVDTLNTTAFGYYNNEDETPLENLNFIKVKQGKGYYYFHTLPETFSNFYLLKENNQKYAEKVLSHVNPSVVYWDNYIKSGRKIVKSPMRFILNQTPLKWAYYLTALGLILFVVFKGKREQRVIEVIEPLKNSTIEFTKTIGDLHFQHKDFSNIIAKKITYFLEKIRTQYYLDTQKLDNSFVKKLATKSSHTTEETQKLITEINNLKNKSFHTENDLINLNKLLEDFKL